MNKQLPAYFKDYLDEKFNHTYDKINGVDAKVNGVKKEVNGVKTHLKSINGDISDIKAEQIRVKAAQNAMLPIFNKTVKGVGENGKKIRYIVIALVLGSVVWIKESRDMIIGIVSQLLAGI